jgi:hypothetical protein
MLLLTKQTKGLAVNNLINLTFYKQSFSHLSTSIPNIDESTISKEILEVQTLKQLRAFAKQHKINLKGIRLKNKIVNVILAYFLRARASTAPVEILDRKFDIITNDFDYIDVSLWFRGNKKSLDRCLSTRQFKRLLAHYVKKEKVEPDNSLYPVIQTNKDNSIFLPPILAVHVASHLSVKLHYEILEYYLYSKVSQIEAMYEAKIESLKQDNINLQLGIKLNKKA